MCLTLDVLKSIQNDLIFHSIDNIINISDCEHINYKPQKVLPFDKLFWLDYSPINETEIENQSIILPKIRAVS